MRSLLAIVLFAITSPGQDKVVVVGSKNFTESVVLAELMAQMIEAHTDLQVERRVNLGGTKICFGALEAGEIDVYAEYTGTAWAVILKEPGPIQDPLRTFFHVRRRCRAEHGVEWLDPFGLNNSYAIAMREAQAEELGVRRISDLLAHQDRLRAGFSIEFGSREDGYPGLARAYGLQLGDVRTLEHGLAYKAMQSGVIDLMDAYSTDGKLLRYKLRVLADDRAFFPPYNAAPVVRVATLEKHPELRAVFARLGLQLSDAAAQALNHAVETEGQTPAMAAGAFLEKAGLTAEVERGAPREGGRPGFLAMMYERRGTTLQLVVSHLFLTFSAVLLAALLAIPLGIHITTRPRLGQLALGVAGILQTVPSLALLAFMIPVLGLGVKAAVAALFLYALLPILRNTYTGIQEVDPDLVDAAQGMGMRPGQILRRVQLPLALRTIMAGIRTSAVISIGVATLAAFVGAGGLGEPIVEGLYLDDTNLILAGAIPAALLAILVDLGLGRLEILLQPRTVAADN